MIEMARFTREDWYGFAGCERFADGTEPFIGGLRVDGSAAVVIHDAEGIHVVWGGMMEDDCGIHVNAAGDIVADHEDFFADYDVHADGAKTADDVLAALQPEMTSIALKALGFTVPAGACGGVVLDGAA